MGDPYYTPQYTAKYVTEREKLTAERDKFRLTLEAICERGCNCNKLTDPVAICAGCLAKEALKP